MESILRERGFLMTRSLFYTLGGGGENGGGMSEEGVEALTLAADESGVELFRASFQEIVGRKLALTDTPSNETPRLVVNIGGALSNLGRDEAVITLRNGPLFPQDSAGAGDGLISMSLQRGVPVLHILNLRSLAERSGIDFEKRRPFFVSFAGYSLAAPLAGIILFVLILATHRRWSWEDANS
jgi:poly-gamma-glutamate system protein